MCTNDCGKYEAYLPKLSILAGKVYLHEFVRVLGVIHSKPCNN